MVDYVNQVVDLGAAANDGNGDTLRAGMDKLNDNWASFRGAADWDAASFDINFPKIVTKSGLHPTFQVYNSVSDVDVTGDSTVYTVDFDTEVYDQGGNFTADTFTAPVTGKYQFDILIYLKGLLSSHTDGNIQLITSNNSYILWLGNPTAIRDGNSNQLVFGGSIQVDMDASDTAHVNLLVSNGTKVIDVHGASNRPTIFTGTLML